MQDHIRDMMNAWSLADANRPSRRNLLKEEEKRVRAAQLAKFESKND